MMYNLPEVMRDMQDEGDTGSESKDDPFHSETRIRVLNLQERRPIGNEAQCVSEPSLFIVRARISGNGNFSIGDLIDLPNENCGPLSEVRLRDLSSGARQELVPSICESIRYEPDRHLDFYNRANNLSLKFHAFQLLPGVGNSKAQQMVGLRGMAGWGSFEEVDDSCAIDSVHLLAERYLKEMEDPAQTPRLLDLLVRSERLQ
tara:strand:+ start:2064 stop:2672 length:609 start_codon:yes stop_codon:yes gene_type:complete